MMRSIETVAFQHHVMPNRMEILVCLSVAVFGLII
jgi:hypothetical protein